MQSDTCICTPTYAQCTHTPIRIEIWQFYCKIYATIATVHTEPIAMFAVYSYFVVMRDLSYLCSSELHLINYHHNSVNLNRADSVVVCKLCGKLFQ